MDRQMRLLLVLAGLGGATWGVAWSVLAPYLRGLGYSGAQYGLVGSTAVLSSALMTLLAGTLSDRLGSRKVIAAGLAGQSLAMLLISSGDPARVAAGFFLNGASNAMSFTGQQALVSRSGSDERLHYTFSYVAAAGTLGGALGSFAGWLPVLASRHLGVGLIQAYRATLAFSSLLPLAGILAVAPLREDLGSPRGGGSILEGWRRLGGRFARVALANVLVGFGAAMSIHNIDYYFAAKYNVTSAQLGSVLGLQQLVMAYLMTRMPRLADRVGSPLKVYLAVSYSSVPLLVAMTIVDSFPVAAALYLVRSVLMNVANPLFNAVVMRLVPRSLRGTASAVLSLSWTLPASGGRAVGGYLLDVDLELPLRLTAALYTLALTYIALLFPDELRSGPASLRARSLPVSGA